MPARRHIPVVAALVLMPAAWAGAPLPSPPEGRGSRHWVKQSHRVEYCRQRDTAESIRHAEWRQIDPRFASRGR